MAAASNCTCNCVDSLSLKNGATVGRDLTILHNPPHYLLQINPQIYILIWKSFFSVMNMKMDWNETGRQMYPSLSPPTIHYTRSTCLFNKSKRLVTNQHWPRISLTEVFLSSSSVSACSGRPHQQILDNFSNNWTPKQCNFILVFDLCVSKPGLHTHRQYTYHYFFYM